LKPYLAISPNRTCKPHGFRVSSDHMYKSNNIHFTLISLYNICGTLNGPIAVTISDPSTAGIITLNNTNMNDRIPLYLA